MNDRELLDWNDPKPAIPAWCPLRSNARGNAPDTARTEGPEA